MFIEFWAINSSKNYWQIFLRFIDKLRQKLIRQFNYSKNKNSDHSSNAHAKVGKSKSTMIPFGGGGGQREALSVLPSGKGPYTYNVPQMSNFQEGYSE
jgi:hypothetical protein